MLTVGLAASLVHGQRPNATPRVAQGPNGFFQSLFRLQQRADDEENAVADAADELPADAQEADSAQPDALEGALQDAARRGQFPNSVNFQQPVRIPIRTPDVNVTARDGLVSIVVREASLKDVVAMIGETLRLNVVCADDVAGTLSISLERVPLEQALDALTAATGCTWTVHNNIIYVTRLTAGGQLAPEIQGRSFEVFELDYVPATDVVAIISSLLSPAGQAFPVSSATDDNRKAREAIVVEDVAASVERIRQRIAFLDVAPRQVQIEAHILEVELTDNLRHGVNFEQAMNMSGHSFSLSTNGFANSNAQQAFFAEISGPDLNGLIEWLQVSSDAKTLASPSLTVLNKQSASIQVGQQLGFRVTTTTETSTTEGVETLDVGVLLEVTPQISRDNRVMLSVRPEISSGQVNPNTGLPEEELTELQTDVLLENGKGIVIGGLIQEKDEHSQSKVPLFGDLHLIGKLFGLQAEERRRSEIIIVLIPRVIPLPADRQAIDDFKYHAATTPLLHGPLLRMDRPWEPRLKDPVHNPNYFPTWNDRCGCGGKGQFGACQPELAPGKPFHPTPAANEAPPETSRRSAPNYGRLEAARPGAGGQAGPSGGAASRRTSGVAPVYLDLSRRSSPGGRQPSLRLFPPLTPEQSVPAREIARQPVAPRHR